MISLGARSSVFRAMLFGSMKEGHQKEIELKEALWTPFVRFWNTSTLSQQRSLPKRKEKEGGNEQEKGKEKENSQTSESRIIGMCKAFLFLHPKVFRIRTLPELRRRESCVVGTGLRFGTKGGGHLQELSPVGKESSKGEEVEGEQKGASRDYGECFQCDSLSFTASQRVGSRCCSFEPF